MLSRGARATATAIAARPRPRARAARRPRAARARASTDDDVARSSMDDGRVNRFVERESGAKRSERAVIGFWQTFAARASEARRKHFDGRKTVSSKDGTKAK